MPDKGGSTETTAMHATPRAMKKKWIFSAQIKKRLKLLHPKKIFFSFAKKMR